jgi:uncharacterized membrane protein YdbT with pleckstrin-like domain
VPFPDKLLNENEEKVLDLHPHWFYLVRPILALVAAVLLGIAALATELPGAVDVLIALLVLAALAWFGAEYARWATTNFVVTTDRLIYRHGVLAKRGIEIPLERVNTVFFSQSIFERLLGSGDLVIESAGEMGRQEFSNVRKPSAVQNEIHRQMEANENRKFDRINRNVVPQAAPPSIPEQIAQLDGLRQQGLLTDAEFEEKKAELLRRM